MRSKYLAKSILSTRLLLVRNLLTTTDNSFALSRLFFTAHLWNWPFYNIRNLNGLTWELAVIQIQALPHEAQPAPKARQMTRGRTTKSAVRPGQAANVNGWWIVVWSSVASNGWLVVVGYYGIMSNFLRWKRKRQVMACTRTKPATICLRTCCNAANETCDVLLSQCGNTSCRRKSSRGKLAINAFLHESRTTCVYQTAWSSWRSNSRLGLFGWLKQWHGGVSPGERSNHRAAVHQRWSYHHQIIRLTSLQHQIVNIFFDISSMTVISWPNHSPAAHTFEPLVQLFGPPGHCFGAGETIEPSVVLRNYWSWLKSSRNHLKETVTSTRIWQLTVIIDSIEMYWMFISSAIMLANQCRQ